eukprot:889525-Pleurochrysis_carterae.AAC.1
MAASLPLHNFWNMGGLPSIRSHKTPSLRKQAISRMHASASTAHACVIWPTHMYSPGYRVPYVLAGDYFYGRAAAQFSARALCELLRFIHETASL